MGAFILHLVPCSKRPNIYVSKKVLLLSIFGIAILTTLPTIQLILAFYKFVGVMEIIKSALFMFEVGKALIITLILSFLLFIYLLIFDISKKSYYSYGGLFITFLLIITLGWASHSSALAPTGYLTHSLHFLSVSTWIGILLVIGWFSTNHNNWIEFLRWFSTVAIICFILTALTGIIMMKLMVDSYKDYVNAWMLSYGQALLIKHLLIIPLLLFAFMNSVLIKKRVKENGEFNPKSWLKAESIFVLFIFSATSLLGNLMPPHVHDEETIFKEKDASKLFEFFYQGEVKDGMELVISYGFNSLILIVLAILFLGLTILSFIKKTPPFLSIIMSVIFILTSYFSLMLSLK
jgi:putative copper export protein